MVEARGVEPLSIKRSARPSTCLGDLCCRRLLRIVTPQTPKRPRNRIHPTPRSPRRKASLLSSYPFLAGVSPDTSRHVRPRERDLRDLRLFVLIRFLTRPTNHPRHASLASNFMSRPNTPPVGSKLPEKRQTSRRRTAGPTRLRNGYGGGDTAATALFTEGT